MKYYKKIAKTQQIKTGSPCERTAENVLLGTKLVCKAAKIPLTSSTAELTRQRFDIAIANINNRKLERITIKSYLLQMQGLFARWCCPYYEDIGWDIPQIKIPTFRAYAPRYTRPSPELLARLKDWYHNLKGEYWFAATMMLEFAMRNGDVLRLKKENFVSQQERTEDGKIVIRHYLSYTPHKTKNSSRRTVFWPICDFIWKIFDDYGGLDGLDVTKETFAEINKDLRKLGFCGNKAAYEMRKICIDFYYRLRGIEEAVAISGDSIKTIMWYYADPSRANSDTISVVDEL